MGKCVSKIWEWPRVKDGAERRVRNSVGKPWEIPWESHGKASVMRAVGKTMGKDRGKAWWEKHVGGVHVRNTARWKKKKQIRRFSGEPTTNYI